MCGRYTLTTNIQTIAKVFDVEPTLETQPRYNVAPTQEVVTIVHNGQKHLAWMRWGLIPRWAKDAAIGSKMINLRAETLGEKPSFRRLLDSKRCLLIADGFFEWKQENGVKYPMYFTLKDKEPFAFAGVWDTWANPQGEQIRSCSLITTEPNDLVAQVHNRMPVILPEEARQEWLNLDIRDTAFLEQLLVPFPADEMTVRQVSRAVNNPSVDNPSVLA
jgi:putative SOS response-associated peptidase YedK